MEVMYCIMNFWLLTERMEIMKTLYKSQNKVVAGVCGGIAEYFGWDPSLVRIATAIFCCFAGSGVIAYIVGAVVIPDYPSDDSSVYDSEYKEMK